METQRKECYQRKKHNWLKKREEFKTLKVSFSELRKKRLKEKKGMEEPSAKGDDYDIWNDLENVIKDNQFVLKTLENYKVTIEIKEAEEKIREIHSKNPTNQKDCWFVHHNQLEYKKDTKIGQGKFGSVYSGSFRKDLPVAVKILRNKSGGKEKLAKNFLKEKTVMVKLKHPYIVQLYAVSQDEEGNHILVQEIMKNGNLLDYLKQLVPSAAIQIIEDASFKHFLSWCVDMARGMAHLESLNIVHRDLAARNVLLDENKRAKLRILGWPFLGCSQSRGVTIFLSGGLHQKHFLIKSLVQRVMSGLLGSLSGKYLHLEENLTVLLVLKISRRK